MLGISFWPILVFGKDKIFDEAEPIWNIHVFEAVSGNGWMIIIMIFKNIFTRNLFLKKKQKKFFQQHIMLSNKKPMEKIILYNKTSIEVWILFSTTHHVAGTIT